MANQEYNKSVLIKELSLAQCGRTSLYKHINGALVFSPVVAQNTQSYYWFDIRQANLRRRDIMSPVTTILLVRVVPDLFVWAEFEKIQRMIDVIIPYRNDKAGGIWGFIVDLETGIIISRDNPSIHTECEIWDRLTLKRNASLF